MRGKPGSGLSLTRRARLPVPCLMMVTDSRLAGGADALVLAVRQALSGGVNVVQLREKHLPPDQLLGLARRLREATSGRALLLVNGPIEVAVDSDADGLHLPENAPSVQRPHEMFLIGRSVHSLEAAERAAAESADYVVAGPVFQTASHPGEPAAGIRLIRGTSTAVPLPVLAIGGITAEGVGPVMRAGASGVVVISAILGERSPEGGARVLREALDAAYSRLDRVGG